MPILQPSLPPSLQRFDTSNNESSIYIENVTEHRVGSAAEALTLIE